MTSAQTIAMEGRLEQLSLLVMALAREPKDRLGPAERREATGDAGTEELVIADGMDLLDQLGIAGHHDRHVEHVHGEGRAEGLAPLVQCGDRCAHQSLGP